MGWDYPDISLEEMMKLVKGFVDIMILASGYQSSGRLAHWDANNIKQAIQWGSFFESVLRCMSSSDAYQDSVKELDAALSEMTSDPSFPEGLTNLSSNTLTRARSFVLGYLFHTLPLRVSHVEAFLTAIIEMELDKISESDCDCLSVYLNKLSLQNRTLNLVLERRGSVKDSITVLEEITQTVTAGKFPDDDLTKFTLQEIIKRQSSVSCIFAAETGLDIMTNAIRRSSLTGSGSSLLKEQLKCDGASAPVGSSEQFVDFVTWNQWKSECLSYFLNKKTVRLVSGAGMIFSASKMQWIQVFSRLTSLAECTDDNLGETIMLDSFVISVKVLLKLEGRGNTNEKNSFIDHVSCGLPYLSGELSAGNSLRKHPLYLAGQWSMDHSAYNWAGVCRPFCI